MVADALHHAHLMRDDDNGNAERLIDLTDELQDRLRRRRVERTGRLVAKKNLRLARKRPGNRHALLLSAGELA